MFMIYFLLIDLFLFLNLMNRLNHISISLNYVFSKNLSYGIIYNQLFYLIAGFRIQFELRCFENKIVLFRNICIKIRLYFNKVATFYNLIIDYLII